jgi:hypothetical protein
LALTSIFSVELPGIETVNNTVDLRQRFTGQHDSAWRITPEQANVLTAVSTFI